MSSLSLQGKLMNVQLSTSRLRTAPGMGSHTGCYVCGKYGHWSKDCPVSGNGSHSEGARGRGGWAPPRGSPIYGRGSHGMGDDYMGGSTYSRPGYAGGLPPPSRRFIAYSSDPGDRYARAAGTPPERSSVYDRERLHSSLDYYQKYRARTYGSSYFEDRHLTYIPPPPPPPPSLSKLTTTVASYNRQPLPQSSSAATCYTEDRSPIRRIPVLTTSYAYERTRLSPVSASSSSYAAPRPKDSYTSRYAPY